MSTSNRISHDAELNILRSVLDNKSFGEAAYRGLNGDYFIDPDYGKTWEYMRDHYRDFGAVPAIETLLEDQPELTSFILSAEAVEPTEFYADKILEAYARRGIATELRTVLPKLETDVGKGIAEIRQVASKFELIRENRDVMTLGNTAKERLEMYEAPNVYGIPFGFDTLDDSTLGAHPGDLIGIVARPGQGKSWLLLKMAHNAWKDGNRVLVIATELQPLSMLQRVDTLHSQLDYDLFKKRAIPTERFKTYKSWLQNLPRGDEFHIVSGTGMTPSAINVLIEQVKPDALFIDGVYLLDSDRKANKDWEKIRYLANELKHNVAVRNNIPVYFNTQFNSSVGTAVGGKKKVEGGLENIGYGDEFGKAADLFLSIHRTAEDAAAKVLSLKVIKGRESAEGVQFYVDFDFSRMSLHETDPVYPEGEAKAGLAW